MFFQNPHHTEKWTFHSHRRCPNRTKTLAQIETEQEWFNEKLFSSMNVFSTREPHSDDSRAGEKTVCLCSFHSSRFGRFWREVCVPLTKLFLRVSWNFPLFLPKVSTTFELEQALINMDGEILLGEEGQCPLCQKIFNRKTSLLNHIRNHSADKKYVCGYCQKGFSQQANLRNHERIHTNDRPYVWWVKWFANHRLDLIQNLLASTAAKRLRKSQTSTTTDDSTPANVHSYASRWIAVGRLRKSPTWTITWRLTIRFSSTCAVSARRNSTRSRSWIITWGRMESLWRRRSRRAVSSPATSARLSSTTKLSSSGTSSGTPRADFSRAPSPAAPKASRRRISSTSISRTSTRTSFTGRRSCDTFRSRFFSFPAIPTTVPASRRSRSRKMSESHKITSHKFPFKVRKSFGAIEQFFTISL